MTEVERKASWQVSSKRKRRPRGRPKGHRISVQQSEQITAICVRLGLPGGLLTFRDVAAELSKRSGIHVGLGTVYRFSKGVEPTRASVRAALGLPVLALAPVCACGEFHPAKRCPNAPRAARYASLFDWPVRKLRQALKERR